MGPEVLTGIFAKMIESSLAIAALLLLIWFLYEQIKIITKDRDHYREGEKKCTEGKIAERDQLQKDNEELKKQIELIRNLNPKN